MIPVDMDDILCNRQASELAGFSQKYLMILMALTFLNLQIKLFKKLILPKKKTIKMTFKNASLVLFRIVYSGYLLPLKRKQ